MTRKHVIVVLSALVLAVIALNLLGRVWWCEGGGLNPWGPVESRHNSQHLLDAYTFTHVLHGILFYAIAWLFLRGPANRPRRVVLVMVTESIWEVFENTSFIIQRYREATIALGYYGDSIANSLGDIAACAAGVLIAARLPIWASIAAIVAIESLLLFFIRDSLALNIIMLLWPVEAIREWQMS